MSEFVLEARPLSIKNIAKMAMNIRQQISQVSGISADRKKFPVVDIAEKLFPNVIKDYNFLIGFIDDMRHEEGKKYLGGNVICIREDVYIKACEGEGRARFTIAHEFGHLFLHSQDRLSLNRSSKELPAYKNPEWQANKFASFLLMPTNLIEKYEILDERTISEEFLVSTEAAKFRIETYHRHGV